MNTSLLRVRNVVALVVLGALLTDVSAQAQSSASKSPRSSRRASSAQQSNAAQLAAAERSSKLNCERFMRRHSSIVNSQLDERTRQNMCNYSYTRDVFSSAEQIASIEQCLLFLTTHSNSSLYYCTDPDLVQDFGRREVRHSFEQCVQNVSARLVPYSRPRNNGVILSTVPSVNSRQSDIVAACILSARMRQIGGNDVQSYEACTNFLVSNNMLGDSAHMSFGNCVIDPLLSVFSEPSLVRLYTECVNIFAGGGGAWVERECTNMMSNYMRYVHGNAAQVQAYNVCRSMGNNYGACLDGARGDHERNPQPESQSAAGAGD